VAIPPELRLRVRVPPLHEPIRYGDLFSGLGTSFWAAAAAHPMRPFSHVFACDSEPASRTWLSFHIPHGRLFTNVHGDFTRAMAQAEMYADVLTAGFPCQPYSNAGKGQGLLDERNRGLTIFPLLEYIKLQQPRVVILENVAGLLKQHKETLIAILEALKGIRDNTTGGQCYAVSFRVLNTQNFNVPQHRERVYIVCVKLCGRRTVPFTWPTGSSSGSPKTLSELFDADRQKLPAQSFEDGNYPTFSSTTVQKNVAEALVKLRRVASKKAMRVEDLPAVLDAGSSRCNLAVQGCPCLTHSRCKGGGFLSMQHGTALTTTEMLRLQGFSQTDISTMQLDVVAPGALRGMIGNAFSKCVCMEVMKAAIAAAEAPA
jgi:DNA-cytosine methyltransferase